MQKISDKLILKMINYFDGDDRRINHALKVYAFAKNIAELEGIIEEKKEIVEISSILHDIGIKVSEEKYNSSAGKYQELEGPQVARDLLDEFNIEKNIIDRVCFLIAHHHTYSNIDDIDLQILIEADFIVNIYEDSMKNDAIETVKSKYFKTKTAIEILNSMYLKKPEK